jgi:hypothetical protein
MGSLIYPLSPDGGEGQGEGEFNFSSTPINIIIFVRLFVES